jgi:hypothetical protein
MAWRAESRKNEAPAMSVESQLREKKRETNCFRADESAGPRCLWRRHHGAGIRKPSPNPKTSLQGACPVPPGADMVGESSPLAKLSHFA